jgi:hypothetical protein
VPSRFDSEPFKFIVNGKTAYIHKALVARVSKPLDRLMNGHMSEAQLGEAELKEVDEETFARFCQWLYAGAYSAAAFSNRPAADMGTLKKAGMLKTHTDITLMLRQSL